MAISPGDNTMASDHPLSDGPESTWSTFFKDNEFLLQIDKDVRRLCPDISFFQQVIQSWTNCLMNWHRMCSEIWCFCSN